MRRRRKTNQLLQGPGLFKMTSCKYKNFHSVIFEADSLEEAKEIALETWKEYQHSGMGLVRIDRKTKRGILGEGLRYVNKQFTREKKKPQRRD